MKKYILVILSVLFVGHVMAQKLTVESIKVDAGKTADLVIGIDASEAVQAVQFTLVLPEGASVEMDGEDYIADPLTESDGGIMPKRNSQIQANKKDDGILIVAFNTKGKFVAGTGDFVTISIEAAADADGKVLNCQLKDIKAGSLADDNSVVSAGEFSDVVFQIGVGVDTGINSISLDDPNAEIYNLNGQRVKNVKKGVYVVNGKKVAVK